MINAQIILDSVNLATGDRLTTFAIRIPKFILAEANTHRSLSRNAASSRAIPAKKIRHQVINDPVIPVHFGRNGKGMTASDELPPFKKWLALTAWRLARYPACVFHWFLSEVVGLHKQICNRILEPWMWADVLLSATEWKNFFALRCHRDAQPEFQAVATQMRQLLLTSTPQKLRPGEWHLPFIGNLEKERLPLEMQKQISAARCARISYQLPEGGFSTPDRDLELCSRLTAPPLHASPFEGVAIALPKRERSANFMGWKQWRKDFPEEANGDYS